MVVEPERYNEWGEWRPILARCSGDVFSRIMAAASRTESREVRAVLEYTGCTNIIGIEFVVLASFRSAGPAWSGTDELIARLCFDGSESPLTPFPQFIYDGWLPLAAGTEEVIRDGLRRIDETVALAARLYGARARWFPKYVECSPEQKAYRLLAEDEEARLPALAKQIEELPIALQRSLHGAIHWLQHSKDARRPTDRFLALWLAFEGLLHSLYEHASEVGLPLDDRPASKDKRRELRREETRAILTAAMACGDLDRDPEEVARRAYFDGVVGIRMRCEQVLRAALGKDARVDWVWRKDESGVSPQGLRSDIVHRAANQLPGSVKLNSICDTLGDLVSELVIRAHRRSWLGSTLPTRQSAYRIAGGMESVNTPGGGWESSGDFRITLGLLASKGLL